MTITLPHPRALILWILVLGAVSAVGWVVLSNYLSPSTERTTLTPGATPPAASASGAPAATPPAAPATPSPAPPAVETTASAEAAWPWFRRVVEEGMVRQGFPGDIWLLAGSVVASIVVLVGLVLLCKGSGVWPKRIATGVIALTFAVVIFYGVRHLISGWIGEDAVQHASQVSRAAIRSTIGVEARPPGGSASAAGLGAGGGTPAAGSGTTPISVDLRSSATLTVPVHYDTGPVRVEFPAGRYAWRECWQPGVNNPPAFASIPREDAGGRGYLYPQIEASTSAVLVLREDVRRKLQETGMSLRIKFARGSTRPTCG